MTTPNPLEPHVTTTRPFAHDTEIEIKSGNETGAITVKAGNTMTTTVTVLDDDDDTDTPQYDWYPTTEPVRVSTPDELAVALRSMSVSEGGGIISGAGGGIIEVMTQSAADELTAQLSYDVRGKPSNRIVIRPGADGVRIRSTLVNVNGHLEHIALAGWLHEPDEHGGLALKFHGTHNHLTFMNTQFRRWTQVFEFKHAGDKDANPHDIEFSNFLFSKIFNKNAPVQTVDNQNDKSNRAQGGSLHGERYLFRNGVCSGIGWDMEGDPDRRKVSKFDQCFYLLQRAEDVEFENCKWYGVANAAIQCKGNGLLVRNCTFDKSTVAVTLGTNEDEQYPATAIIEDCQILDMIPLNHLDDPSLPSEQRIRANSGVGFSFCNADGVTIRNVSMFTASGTRKVFAWFATDNNPSNARLSMRNILIEDCDIMGNDLAQVRDHQQPDTGFHARFEGIKGTGSRAVIVRNTTPSNKREIVANVTLDGQQVEVA